MTKRENEDITRYLSSPIDFINELFKLPSIKNCLVGIDLYSHQKTAIEKIHNNKFVIFKHPRQHTTTLTAYILWATVLTDNIKVAVIPRADVSEEILNRYLYALTVLPKNIQKKTIKVSNDEIVLENNSSIKLQSFDGIANCNYDIVLINDLPEKTPDQLNNAFVSIQHKPETKLIVTSSTNNKSVFDYYWNEALTGVSQFIPVEIAFNDIKKYTTDVLDSADYEVGC